MKNISSPSPYAKFLDSRREGTKKLYWNFDFNVIEDIKCTLMNVDSYFYISFLENKIINIHFTHATEYQLFSLKGIGIGISTF